MLPCCIFNLVYHVPGHEQSNIDRKTMKQWAASSHRSVNCTLFIIYGVRTSFTEPISSCDDCILLSALKSLNCTEYVCVLAYKDLQSRQETRNAAWLKEGWDANVYYTSE